MFQAGRAARRPEAVAAARRRQSWGLALNTRHAWAASAGRAPGGMAYPAVRR